MIAVFRKHAFPPGLGRRARKVFRARGTPKMTIRTTWSKITFPHGFTLPGSDELLPAGEYDLMVEEEHLQGLTFDAYRRTGTFLQVTGHPRHPGRIEMYPVSEADLHMALEQPGLEDGPVTG
jgi:hypothetical protein